MVSVSSLVSELSTALGSLVDDLNGLHAAVNHSSLTTAWIVTRLLAAFGPTDGI